MAGDAGRASEARKRRPTPNTAPGLSARLVGRARGVERSEAPAKRSAE